MPLINTKDWKNAVVSNYAEYGHNDRYSVWRNGRWTSGDWLRGTWLKGDIYVDGKFYPSKVSPKSFHKPTKTLSLNYATYI